MHDESENSTAKETNYPIQKSMNDNKLAEQTITEENKVPSTGSSQAMPTTPSNTVQQRAPVKASLQTPPYVPPSVSRIMLFGTTTCGYDTGSGGTRIYARPIGAHAVMLGDTSIISVSWVWEFEGDTSGMSGIPSGVVVDKVPSGQRSATLSYFFQAHGSTSGFKYRIKSISPNIVFSEWQTVPASGPCQ